MAAPTYEDALATVTAPGARFEIEDVEVRGQTYKYFKNTAPNLRAIFDTARTRDGIFLVYEDERWTFADTMAKADQIADALVNQYDVAKGDRVAIGMRNYPEWVASFVAITSIGAVSVSLNAWWTEEEMAYGIEDSGAKILIADRERIERASPALKNGALQALAVRAEGELPPNTRHLNDVLRPNATLPDVRVEPDDDATILYTSGTTGFPKGAVSTHRNVLSAIMAFGCRAQVRAAMRAGQPPHPFPIVFILIVPLFHVTGSVAVMLNAFIAGVKLVMMYKWNPERALELIERERVTNFVGVPTMSWDLLESPDFAKRDTSSLMNVGGGGAPAPPELVRRVDKSFAKARPNIGYGMTETCAYGPQNDGDDYIRKPTSTGRTVPVLEMRVIDVNGRALGPGEVGEICFRGPNVFRGYWNKPEATAEVLQDGWLRSGDIGRIDNEGFIYVEDRAKDMVLRGGENIYCAEVEAAVYEHSAVHEAAVFGTPHDRLGEEVAAAIYLKPGETLDPEVLREHLAARIASFKIPSRIEIRTEPLPRNAAGKVLKRTLRDETTSR
ncbi:MAG: class I adenylate-forming enzyme family protein [Candidatus Binatia bacterium]|nr:class I adenylate-forming enzyme family protein [Candidatus Binatia bacterium]